MRLVCFFWGEGQGFGWGWLEVCGWAFWRARAVFAEWVQLFIGACDSGDTDFRGVGGWS